MKHFIIKKNMIYILITTIILISTMLYKVNLKLPKIGINGDCYNLVLRNWNHSDKYHHFRKVLNNINDKYILIEGGITNGGGYEFYFVNLDKKYIWADFIGIKGRFRINQDFVNNILPLIKNVTNKNQIFDGTTNVATDDIVFILSYFDQKSMVKFGTYSFHFGLIEDNEYRDIIITNKNILRNIMFIIEEEIYRQNPRLFDKRPSFI